MRRVGEEGNLTICHARLNSMWRRVIVSALRLRRSAECRGSDDEREAPDDGEHDRAGLRFRGSGDLAHRDARCDGRYVMLVTGDVGVDRETWTLGKTVDVTL